MTLPVRIVEAEVQAYVDGRLDERRCAVVEHWLDAHADEASRVAAYRRLGEQWRAAYAPVLDEPVPASLLAALPAAAPRWPVLAQAEAIAAVLIVTALAVWQLAEP